MIFLSTPSARRATSAKRNINGSTINFYPRPPRGGRPAGCLADLFPAGFLSTPSARRATTSFHFCVTLVLISIHALREEGDCPLNGPASPASRFLSTPSARRATLLVLTERKTRNISIHALREEGDTYRWSTLKKPRYFYPRPPRGGRLKASVTLYTLPNFYPRPPRGGRLY